MNLQRKTLFLLAAVTFSMLSNMALSHEGAAGIVKERMDAMEVMGDHSSAVADMFKGKAAFDPDAIADAIEVFIEHGKRMPSLFPDTSPSRSGGKTEALPAVWLQWDDFVQMAENLVERSEALKVLVASTDDERTLRRAFFRTTKSCSGCHKRFRKPKD